MLGPWPVPWHWQGKRPEGPGTLTPWPVPWRWRGQKRPEGPRMLGPWPVPWHWWGSGGRRGRGCSAPGRCRGTGREHVGPTLTHWHRLRRSLSSLQVKTSHPARAPARDNCIAHEAQDVVTVSCKAAERQMRVFKPTHDTPW